MKYDKETLSQLDLIQLCCLSNVESGKAHEVVVLVFLSILGILASPVLWLKLTGVITGIGWAVCGIVVYVRLDRIGDELEKKYEEWKNQTEAEGGAQ